ASQLSESLNFSRRIGRPASGQMVEVPRAGSGSAGRQMTVILECDRMQLGRLVYQLNNDETQRVGVKLAGGNA
ncbi:MAG: hypothetical protein K6F80_06555, partial [Oscillospiraceae bacterium]|nr:hypothetical protein [Oscillospiraceae bacterium]